MYSIYNKSVESQPISSITPTAQVPPVSSTPTIPPKTTKPIFLVRPEKKKHPYLIVILIIIAVLAILAGLWFFFRPTTNGNIISPFGKITDKTDEKTVENPLTGIMYTEKDAMPWKGVRPIGAMVNNHDAARPQSGLMEADVVYEMVAEGGITRYIAFFLTNSPLKVGPIRSIREYYLVLVKEMGDGMIMHIGWSPQALAAIEAWPVRSLNRLGLNCENVLPDPTDYECWRNKARVDADVPWEHTAYANIVELRKKGETAGWQGATDNLRAWKFKDNTTAYSAMPSASEVSIDFWHKGDYSAIFKYNATNNTYMRFLGYDENDQPIIHKDNETGKQIEVKNVIVQFATETSVVGDEKGRLEYELEGSGSAYIFEDGKIIKATWSKTGREGRTLFYDASGNELEFNRGNFWISIVPDRNQDQVVYL